MKITSFRVENYEMKMDRPIGDANGPVGEDVAGGGALWIETNEGITGVAPGGNPAVWSTLPSDRRRGSKVPSSGSGCAWSTSSSKVATKAR